MDEGGSSPEEGRWHGFTTCMQTVNTAGAAAEVTSEEGSTLHPHAHAHAGGLIPFAIYLMNFPLLWVLQFNNINASCWGWLSMYKLVVRSRLPEYEH